jgi:pimeloyl-ACP methyl ester carboxylesterase
MEVQHEVLDPAHEVRKRRRPRILLIHGWGERAVDLGAFVQPLVDRGFQVVGVDLPAHGDKSRGKTNIFEMANAVHGIADQLGGIHAVISRSMGGLVTMVALSDGLELKSVALLAPASNAGQAFEVFSESFSLPHKAVVGLREHIDRRFGPNVWKRLDGTSLARYFRVPALVVHDRDDDQIHLSDSEALAAAWPGSRFVITSELGHSRISRDPRVIDTVCNFLSETVEPISAELASNMTN